MSSLTLRALRSEDRSAIAAWPSYPAPYEKLDYALRRGIGWLDTHVPAYQFGVWQAQKLVAFTLLVPESNRTAEFYIAVHPDLLNRRIGGEAAVATVHVGFTDHPFDDIYLRVRTNHQAGIHLYSKLGFVKTAAMTMETNGEPVDFFRMDLSRQQWRAASGD